ncbi:MAG: RNA polymerase sigma factor [Gammaproteobacteria bacterium]|nr:RNA polymerase sigma factor [Gammaproteobacteria bacterium]
MATKHETKTRFFLDLVRDQQIPLIKYLTTRFADREEAQDIAQEALFRLYRLDHPEKLKNPKAFLFQTAGNLAIDKIRRNKLEQRYIEQEIDHESTTVEDTIRDRNTLSVIEHALYDLPPKCRQAFYMHRSRGYSYPEIARELNVSTSMIEKYITRALKHFRNKLS